MSGRIRTRRVPRQLAELLGLDHGDSKLPAASRVRLTHHAVERFRSRAARGMSLNEARRELMRVKAGAKVVKHRPSWLGGREATPDHALLTVGYVVVEDHEPPIALPIENRDGEAIATTCLVALRR